VLDPAYSLDELLVGFNIFQEETRTVIAVLKHDEH
jgi:hypothetical protein